MKLESKFSGLLTCILLFCIILDTHTGVYGIQTGLEICLKTVIPSLFPFIILSGIFCSRISGHSIKLITPLTKICKIPRGAESIFLLSFLCGYPIGAKLIWQSFQEKHLSERNTLHMLGFCNNAGPAFIFGIVSFLFERPIIPWVIWCIQILSAILVGIILPGDPHETCQLSKSHPLSFTVVMQNGIKTMSMISAWVIFFKMILQYLDKWIFPFIPSTIAVIISGITELSNGCLLLQSIPNESVRFVLSSMFLAMGGICVTMQTVSITDHNGTHAYIKAKILQCIIALMLSFILQTILFNDHKFRTTHNIIFFSLLTITTFIFCVRNKENKCSIRC